MAQIPCPECGRLARVVQRFTLGSTDGQVEHVKLICPDGHALTPLVDDLWPRAVPPLAEVEAVETPEPVEAPEPVEQRRFARHG